MRAVRFVRALLARRRRARWSPLVVFVVPFIFIVLTACQDRARGVRTSTSRCRPSGSSSRTSQEVLDTRNGIMVTALRNSLILTVASVTLIVLLVGDGRLRPPAAAGSRRRSLVSALMLAGLDHPAGDRADDLRPAGARAVQDAGSGSSSSRSPSCMPFAILDLPHLHVGHPARARRGRHHRRRDVVDPLPAGDPAAPAPGDHHRDRGRCRSPSTTTS